MMARLRIPKYSLHKATGQARVWIDGRDHYLGDFDSPESHAEYRRMVDQWQLRRQAPSLPRMTVAQLALLYVAHGKKYYRKDGTATSEVACIQAALKPLLRHFRNMAVSEFTPRMLKTIRQEFVSGGRSRYTANKHTGRIVRMFGWGVSEEFVPVNVVSALREVPSLAAGRCDAAESPGVGPVDVATVNKLQGHIGRNLWGAIQFQLLTACRPGEALRVRPCDIDMQGNVWTYAPESHKTQHHGKKRVILIGPKCQQLLREFMPVGTEMYFFGYDGGRSQYAGHSYTVAIRRACKKAGIEAWKPNQLRHTAATRIRREATIEEAKTVLGHSDLKTTEIYAERDIDAARAVMARIG